MTSIAIVWTDQWVSYVDTLPVIWQHRRNGFKYEIYLYIYLLEAVNPEFEVSTLTSTFQSTVCTLFSMHANNGIVSFMFCLFMYVVILYSRLQVSDMLECEAFFIQDTK